LLSAVDPWQAAHEPPPVSLQTILQLSSRSDYSSVAITLTEGEDALKPTGRRYSTAAPLDDHDDPLAPQRERTG
jgi:hypothetical protein